MSKKILIPTLVLGIVSLIGVGSLVRAHAQTDTYPPIVQRLAEKFGLNVDEVNQTFAEEREAHQEEMRSQLEERLDTAVAEGKITEAQKAVILEKIGEMQANKGNLENLDRETHHTKMRKLHEEFRTWAEENDIDLSELMPLGSGGPKGKFGPGWNR